MLALHLLRRCHSAAHPLCLLAPHDGRVLGAHPPADATAFRRLLGALSPLGPPVLLDPDSIAGPWCFVAPLWGNPALRAPDGRCLEVHFPVLFSLRGLTTIGVALRCWSALAGVRAALDALRQRGEDPSPRVTRGSTLELRRRVLRGVLGYQELGAALEVSGVQVADDLDALVRHLPVSWVAAARGVLSGAAVAPVEPDAWRALLHGLAWRPVNGPPVRLLTLTVKTATILQLGP